MNSQSYFEMDPWTHALEIAQSGSIGRVAAFGVQAVCSYDESVEDILAQWLQRFESLFGRPVSLDTLTAATAASVLLRYDGPVIGRLFVDCADGNAVCNFELVGTAGLLVWKPDTCTLSTLRTSASQETLYQHPYPIALAEAGQS